MGYLNGKAFWKKQLQLDVNANVAVIDQENNAVAVGGDGGDVEVKDSFIAIGSFRTGGGPLETGPGDLVILSGGEGGEAEVEQSNDAEVNQTILDVEVNDCCDPCLEPDHCAVV